MAVVADAAAGRRALQLGATIVQLRAPNLSIRALEEEAVALVAAAPRPVVISSRCDVVIASGAAGVNLPERDVTVQDARSLLGDRLIGRSVHSRESAVEAESAGADYLIFGPVWPSPSHPDARAVGIEALAVAARGVRIPILAIGGVTTERVAECLDAGAAGYAAIRLFR
jgi:thiamine-phosphate pyrophosphorylase